MHRSTAKILSILLIVLTFFAVAIASLADNKDACIWIILVSVGIDLILTRYLRCPYCGRGQGRNWLWAQYCPYCGENLDD